MSCQKHFLTVKNTTLPFIRDTMRNVNQMVWLRKIEIHGKLLGAPRTEKVIVLEQTNIDKQFFRRHAKRALYQVFFTKILRLKLIKITKAVISLTQM